jgi:hypothetical protein
MTTNVAVTLQDGGRSVARTDCCSPESGQKNGAPSLPLQFSCPKAPTQI